MLAAHVQPRVGARVSLPVCTRVHVYMYVCASPPSREHGAVERMRNVGVEEVREGGVAVGRVGATESERTREGREGESEGYMGEG